MFTPITENMKKYLLACLCLMSLALNASASDLENNFLQPPAAAKPWVFLFVNNGNWTKEGITADLEAMVPRST